MTDREMALNLLRAQLTRERLRMTDPAKVKLCRELHAVVEGLLADLPVDSLAVRG